MNIYHKIMEMKDSIILAKNGVGHRNVKYYAVEDIVLAVKKSAKKYSLLINFSIFIDDKDIYTSKVDIINCDNPDENLEYIFPLYKYDIKELSKLDQYKAMDQFRIVGHLYSYAKKYAYSALFDITDCYNSDEEYNVFDKYSTQINNAESEQDLEQVAKNIKDVNLPNMAISNLRHQYSNKKKDVSSNSNYNIKNKEKTKMFGEM